MVENKAIKVVQTNQKVIIRPVNRCWQELPPSFHARLFLTSVSKRAELLLFFFTFSLPLIRLHSCGARLVRPAFASPLILRQPLFTSLQHSSENNEHPIMQPIKCHGTETF